METLSQRTMLFRDIRQVVTTSSGARTFGTRHSNVDSAQDISHLIKYLTDEELRYHQKSRTRISQLLNACRIRESTDTWALGLVSHGSGIPLARTLHKQMELSLVGKIYNPALVPAGGYELGGVGYGYNFAWEDDSTLDSDDMDEECEFDVNNESTSDSDC